MMTKKGETDITIKSDGTIEALTKIIIEEDGVLIASSYHSDCYHPGDEISGADSRLIAIKDVVWTPQVIADYAAAQKEREDFLSGKSKEK